MTVEIIGWFGFATSFCMLLPQVYKVIKTKNTKSLSLSMFLITLIDAIIWFVYGILEGSLQLYIANSCAIVASTIILGFIIYNKIKEPGIKKFFKWFKNT